MIKNILLENQYVSIFLIHLTLEFFQVIFQFNAAHKIPLNWQYRI